MDDFVGVWVFEGLPPVSFVPEEVFIILNGTFFLQEKI